MRNPRLSVVLTAEQEALLWVESNRTGDSIAACIRRAVAVFYADHRKAADYQRELNDQYARRNAGDGRGIG
jgi:hypothetical protein